MLQKSGRLVLWEAMFILELHSAETQVLLVSMHKYSVKVFLQIATHKKLRKILPAYRSFGAFLLLILFYSFRKLSISFFPT